MPLSSVEARYQGLLDWPSTKQTPRYGACQNANNAGRLASQIVQVIHVEQANLVTLSSCAHELSLTHPACVTFFLSLLNKPLSSRDCAGTTSA